MIASALDAVSLTTVILSPVSSTVFCSPPMTTTDEPTGTGTDLTRYAVVPAEVSVTVTSTLIADAVRFDTVAPITVVVVEAGAVYTSTDDVPIEAVTAFLNVLAIVLS